MKLLSVAIPCYNSESYMRYCVETLLPGGEEVEIILVNDGSNKDNTLGVAQSLQAAHPSIIKVIDKQNGGHGSAVNAGLEAATGLYFKVVDSDDWVDADSYPKVLDTLRGFSEENKIDLLVSNFVYDKQGAKKKKTMHYHKILPQNTIFTWKDCGHFPIGKYILMHSIIYRTEILRKSGLKLPEHTFYVDNIFAFSPFPYVEKIFYLDENFYHYFIGRDDQSVNEKVMIKRIDQQLRVNYIMAEEFKKDEEILASNPHLKKYMYDYLEIITAISSIICIISRDKDNYEKKSQLWHHIKEVDFPTYLKMKTRIFGIMRYNTALGHFVSRILYRVAQKAFGFN